MGPQGEVMDWRVRCLREWMAGPVRLCGYYIEDLTPDEIHELRRQVRYCAGWTG